MATIKNKPLVSVCVITYNSEQYIIEALESIKAQTYENIELIVSDDLSSDNTTSLVRNWFDENRNRFVRCELVIPEHNTGTSGNYNRAVKASTGEWIKTVDGDDILTPNCIKDNLEFITSNQEAKVVFSNAMCFHDLEDKKTQYLYFNEKKKQFFNLPTLEQYKSAIHNNPVTSSTLFIYADLLRENPYNEYYFLLEDAPKWIDLLGKGYHFYYFEKVTSYYRQGESVSISSSRFVSPLYYESYQRYFWTERINLMRKYNLQEAYNYHRKLYLLMDISICILRNKRSKTTAFIHNIIKKIIEKAPDYKL